MSRGGKGEQVAASVSVARTKGTDRVISRWTSKSLRGAGVLFLATYPIVAYFAILHWSLRSAAVLLLLAFVPLVLTRQRKESSKLLGTVVGVPLTVLAVSALAASLNDRRLVLALPTLVNAVLLFHFARSLREPMPVVERLARLQQPELSPSEIRYCRSVTWLWVSFFVFNGLVAGVLALTGPLSLWAVYSGVVSYVLIGAVFTGEFLVRRARFRRFGNGVHDRLLKWIWAKEPPE